jgi:hypothetical protein
LISSNIASGLNVREDASSALAVPFLFKTRYLESLFRRTEVEMHLETTYCVQDCSTVHGVMDRLYHKE